MRLIRKKILGKPRLLIILNRFVIGGQAADTIPLAWHLQRDFEIIILCGEKEKGEIEPSILLQKYPEIVLKKIKHLKRTVNPLNDIVALFYIIVYLLKFKAHIIHTHGAKPGFLGRIAGWISRTPVIIHTFHGHFFHSYFSKNVSGIITLIEKAVGKITTCAIALSASQKYELADKYKILPAYKIKIIPLGFAFNSTEENLAVAETFRRRFNVQYSDVAIGIVGRIVPIKNHSFFVKVIRQLLSEMPTSPPAFFIIGDGDLRQQVEDELSRLDIAFSNKELTVNTRVVLTSWLTDINEIMNGLDIVVLTSLNEGTPLSIIEAQFFKKPVVATNVGGVKDSLKDGSTGFLVEGNDLTTFCEKLQLLIADRALRIKMGEAGKNFVTDRFSQQKEVPEMKKLYFSLLNQKGYFLD